MVPFVWRGITAVGASEPLPASYLPALEPARTRYPFDAQPLDELRRTRPAYVIIGDSMALRVDTDRLTELSGERVTSLVHFATGSAYWYLALKNYVAASGVRPKRVAIFFRDAILTDPLFRATEEHRGDLDSAALEREDDLNAVIGTHLNGPWFRAYGLVDRVYHVERARERLDPVVTTWPARVLTGNDAERGGLLKEVNLAFGLDRLRTMTQADIAAASNPDTDFNAAVSGSVLPLLLKLSREHQIPLAFVHVLRRPVNGRPPPESPELRQYIRDLRAYVEQAGALFLEDRSEPELAMLAYDDGDHILETEKRRYTDLFYARLSRAGS